MTDSDMMKARKHTAASILEPWVDRDICEDCDDCDIICLKLKYRIDAALSDLESENKALRDALASGADYYQNKK